MEKSKNTKTEIKKELSHNFMSYRLKEQLKNQNQKYFKSKIYYNKSKHIFNQNKIK